MGKRHFPFLRAVAALVIPILVTAGLILQNSGMRLFGALMLLIVIAASALFQPDELRSIQSLSGRVFARSVLPLLVAALLALGCGYMTAGFALLSLVLMCMAVTLQPRQAMVAAACLVAPMLFLASFPLQRTFPRLAAACGVAGGLLAIAQFGFLLWTNSRRVHSSSVLLLCGIMLTYNAAADEGTTSVLLSAHAHNDYEHTRPLLDALDNGFGSIEADVHVIDGELYVAHDVKQIRPGRTLENLYLAPLQQRVLQNGGHVYASSAEPVQLLVDIKRDGVSTWVALKPMLQRHSRMLTEFRADGTSVTRALTVVLSGERPPLSLLEAETVRFAAFDGRLKDLESTIPVTLMPLVSEPWDDHFEWRGKGDMSAAEKQKLASMVATVHSQNRKLRFWGSPDVPAAWTTFLDAGVDYINTDRLAFAREVLVAQPSAARRSR